MDFQTEYPRFAARSGELFREASKIIPGGAGSSARTVKFGWKPYPPFIASGSGSHLTDVDGHEHVAPGRKQDPGPGFDWAGLQARLADCPLRLPVLRP